MAVPEVAFSGRDRKIPPNSLLTRYSEPRDLLRCGIVHSLSYPKGL